ncbi:hypothetical protein DSL92_03355 [Billgrantia gudaonensis]|uniref:Cobalamin-independent methionine synthase MetE C-terminal/archaeal domain-containing protein n=1 Tax=Billgrantia gudaonensis TaxID=376427 RepID=A0A3S0Q1F9_9GAMM|nr:hypothetical protein DSL92_03355 [Halomonas gudaonensis]
MPVDLASETELDAELTSWLARPPARRNGDLARLLMAAIWRERPVAAATAALDTRRASPRTTGCRRKRWLARLTDADVSRANPYHPVRAPHPAALRICRCSHHHLSSAFPADGGEIRCHPAGLQGWRELSGGLRGAQHVREAIADAVTRQEALGLDVLNGEAERNDMAEYFGEQPEGYAFTRFGWVQSYCLRCVKPPILYGDVIRPAPMTVAWEPACPVVTERPMKGMLTGPRPCCSISCATIKCARPPVARSPWRCG